MAANQQLAWSTVFTIRVLPPELGTLHITLAVSRHDLSRPTRYKWVIVDVFR